MNDLLKLIQALVNGARTVGGLNRMGLTNVLETATAYPNMFLVTSGLVTPVISLIRFTNPLTMNALMALPSVPVIECCGRPVKTTTVQTKNGRAAIRGRCLICKKKHYKIVERKRV